MFTKMFDVLFRDHEDDSEKLNPSAKLREIEQISRPKN